MSGNDDVADPTNVRSENEYREWIIEVKPGGERWGEREQRFRINITADEASL